MIEVIQVYYRHQLRDFHIELNTIAKVLQEASLQNGLVVNHPLYHQLQF